MLKGIDVSHNNGAIDWNAVAKSPMQFAILKCTDGAKYVDPTFQTNLRQARAAGLVVGAYHFFRPLEDPIAQLNNFLAHVGDLTLPIIPCLDVEGISTPGSTNKDEWDQLNVEDRSEAVTDFLDELGVRLKRRAVIYCGPYFANAYLQAVPFGVYNLWISEYARAVEAPFLNYKFWQFGAKGAVAGINGDVDMDLFAGTLADLQAMGVSA